MKLITDRTLTDVLVKNEKGVYGCEDLNRVEQAVQLLSRQAAMMDIHYAPTVKTDWALTNTVSAQTWPTQSQMDRYLANVKNLCILLGLELTLPQTMGGLDYQGANEIEAALLAAHHRIRAVTENYLYSGELFAGEENVL